MAAAEEFAPAWGAWPRGRDGRRAWWLGFLTPLAWYFVVASLWLGGTDLGWAGVGLLSWGAVGAVVVGTVLALLLPSRWRVYFAGVAGGGLVALLLTVALFGGLYLMFVGG
jgi:hypothetical protein